MTDPIVFGADYSVYVRVVRLALAEKGVAYRLEPVDVFAAGGPDGGPLADYRRRHPFGRIPAFEHAGFRLYEAGAIARYVDDAFPGPALMPAAAKVKARVNQIIGILDSYAFRTWVWEIFVERTGAGPPDEAKIAAALPRAETCLAAIGELMAGQRFFLGDQPSLADCHAAPMIALFRLAPEGAAMLAGHPRWLEWWDTMNARPSMAATRGPREAAPG